MRHRWSEEEIHYLREVAPGRLRSEVTEMLNDKFNLELRLKQVESTMKRFKIKNGIDARFKKGQESYNKGKPGYANEKNIATRFKKGSVPINKKPVGSEQIRTFKRRGPGIYVKIAEPNVWREKNLVVWEEHNGPIPKGVVITYLDGNRLNTDIDNLAMITKEEHLMMIRKGLRSNDTELTRVGTNIAKVIVATNDKSKMAAEGKERDGS